MKIEDDRVIRDRRDVVVQEAGQEVVVYHQVGVTRNVGGDREVGIVDVGGAETDMIGEVRGVEDSTVVRGGLIFISEQLWV